MHFNPVPGMNIVLLENKAGMVIVFIMMMLLLPFLCSSKCQQGIQGVSVCPEGTSLVTNVSQTKLFYLRIGDC